jgi:hypothetical protein
MDKIINFLDHIYENIDIYQTLILYQDDRDDINDMRDQLYQKDYPVCIINNINLENLIQNENNLRVFIMNSNIFIDSYLKIKEFNLNKVTVILCLDEASHEKINYYFKNNYINFADKLYIFSIDNV